VPSGVYPTGGLPSIHGTAYLRWGFTTPNLDNTHIEWRGWGYRKIKAKHGWTAADLETTRVALLDPDPAPYPAIPVDFGISGLNIRVRIVRGVDE
jgi:hypothetical protein